MNKVTFKKNNLFLKGPHENLGLLWRATIISSQRDKLDTEQ